MTALHEESSRQFLRTFFEAISAFSGPSTSPTRLISASFLISISLVFKSSKSPATAAALVGIWRRNSTGKEGGEGLLRFARVDVFHREMYIIDIDVWRRF